MKIMEIFISLQILLNLILLMLKFRLRLNHKKSYIPIGNISTDRLFYLFKIYFEIAFTDYYVHKFRLPQNHKIRKTATKKTLQIFTKKVIVKGISFSL